MTFLSFFKLFNILPYGQPAFTSSAVLQSIRGKKPQLHVLQLAAKANSSRMPSNLKRKEHYRKCFKIIFYIFIILYIALHLMAPRFMAFAADTDDLSGFVDNPALEQELNPDQNKSQADDLEGFEDADPQEDFDTQFDVENPDPSDDFPDIDTDISDHVAVENTASNFQIGGFLKFETEYAPNRDHKELSKVRQSLFLESRYRINQDWKFKASAFTFYDFAYLIESRDEFSDETLDDNEYDIEVRDFYLDGKLTDRVSLKAGRQIIAWGDSDYARVTDVINPRDLSQPGLIDLEDARLPLSAIRLSAFFDQWSFDLAFIHEHPGSRILGAGSDFDYYAVLRDPGLSIAEEQNPDTGLNSSGFAAKATWSYNGGDISFVAANTYDHRPYLRYDGIINTLLAFTPEYDRFTTYGISANMAKGNNLFKLETAFRQDRKLMRDDFISQIMAGTATPEVLTVESKDQVAILAGIEYSGISDLRLTLEGEMVHTLDHKNYLSSDENEFRTYVQATYEMLNDTLELDFFWVYFNPGHGNIFRFSTEYDIFDAFTVQAGIAFYESSNSDSMIHPYKDQDRFFLRFKYSF